MSKRKLTRKQAWRAQKVQDERIKRVQKKQQAAESLITQTDGKTEQQGRVIASFGIHYLVENQEKNISPCLSRQNLGAIVVGDHVIWQSTDDSNGVITAILPRSSLLERPNFHGHTKPVAANIDQIFIVSSPVPALQTALIDRYLVAVELTGITPVIVVNKIDLLDENQFETLQNQLEYYSDIGYELQFFSSKQRKSLKRLESMLKSKTSILVGQSGVGKSSTIKALLPDIEIQIGEISQATNLGRHTTSASRLYHLAYDGAIIDSPGVRDFGLWHIPKEQIASGFREFKPFLGRCKFSNCSHIKEPGCAILSATKSNDIPMPRWKNYCEIYKGLC